MRIRVTNAKIREKVIKRGMCNVAGVMMVASKWSPDVEDLNASLIPLWVHLTNVPMSMYSWEGLSFMTSAVGVPDHLHPETIACSNFEVAKVFVKADLTKELPEMIDFTIQGKVVTVGFDYPWLPPRCATCRKWGHYETFCKEKKKEKEVVKETERKEFKTPTSESSKAMKKIAETQQSSGNKQESSNDVTSKTNVDQIVGDKEKQYEDEISMRNKEVEEGEIEEWETVSGEKIGRSSQRLLQYGQVTIATPSRYAALINTDEKGEEMKHGVEEGEEKEAVEEIEEETNNEVADDIYQSMVEENAEANKKGRSRQILPRLSKANHKVIIPETLNRVKDMKRGLRKNH